MDRFDIVDTLIQRPVSFTFKRRRYAVYPLTLGKIQLCSRLIESLGFDSVKTTDDLYGSALDAAKNKKDECLRLISYVTLPGDGCIDESMVRQRIRRFRRIKPKDLASILVLFLVSDKTREIMKEYLIDKESKRLSNVLKIKGKNKGSLSFGGKSIWGTLIDNVCERYGWTYHYVLWGVSFSVLQLLTEDHIKTILLTEDEMKKVSPAISEETIKAEDKTALKEYIPHQNWR
jgi:hypothetical protein